MTEFQDFTDLLASAGIEPKATKLLRHDRRGLSILKRGRDWLGSFISIQSTLNSPFRTEPRYAAHFVPGRPLVNGSSTAVFVGLTEVLGRWPWDPAHLPRLWLAEDKKDPEEDNEAVDQEWLDALAEYEGRLVIDWGFAPRSWHQWAHEKRKPIIRSGGGEEALREAISAAGVAFTLSEAEKFDETLKFEDRELQREIGKNKDNLERQYREQLREVRRNQGKFRTALMKRYGTKCCVTACTVPEVLEAAHIIPFRDGLSCRDLPSNGLLLRRDIHRLFDLMLLSIDPESSSVWINSSFRDSEFGELHGLQVEVLASPHALAEHFAQAQRFFGTVE